MVKKVKGLMSFLLVAVLLMSTVFSDSVFANNGISVEIDGQRVSFSDQQPVIVDGRTLVPVRGVFETLGYDVSWEQSTNTATLSNSVNTVLVTVGSPVFIVNGKALNLDVPAQIINGRTMLPFRAVLESIGCSVDWDGSHNRIIVSSNGINTAIAESMSNNNVNTTSIVGIWLCKRDDTQNIYMEIKSDGTFVAYSQNLANNTWTIQTDEKYVTKGTYTTDSQGKSVLKPSNNNFLGGEYTLSNDGMTLKARYITQPFTRVDSIPKENYEDKYIPDPLPFVVGAWKCNGDYYQFNADGSYIHYYNIRDNKYYGQKVEGTFQIETYTFWDSINGYVEGKHIQGFYLVLNNGNWEVNDTPGVGIPYTKLDSIPLIPDNNNANDENENLDNTEKGNLDDSGNNARHELEVIEGEIKLIEPHATFIESSGKNLLQRSAVVSKAMQSASVPVNETWARSARDKVFDTNVNGMISTINGIDKLSMSYDSSTPLFKDYNEAVSNLTSAWRSAVNTYKNGKNSNDFMSVEERYKQDINDAFATFTYELVRILQEYESEVHRIGNQ